MPKQETQEMWVQSLGREDTLEEEMATHSSILAWKIPWAEEPGMPQSMYFNSNISMDDECMHQQRASCKEGWS